MQALPRDETWKPCCQLTLANIEKRKKEKIQQIKGKGHNGFTVINLFNNGCFLWCLILDMFCAMQFLDMSSLQAALPSAHLSSTLLNGLNESWFPQNPVTPYVPAAAQGEF